MNLSLAEQVALFGLHDTCGSPVSAYLKFALSGAIIADLLSRRRIQIEGRQVQILDSSSIGDDILDEALRSLRSDPDRPLKRWVRGVLAEYQKQRVFDRLVSAGIVERVEDRTLGVFPYRCYPARDMHPENTLRHQLKDVVMGQTAPDATGRMLLSILHASGLTATFLSQEDLAVCGDRINELVQGEPIGCCIRKAVEDEQAAAGAVIVCAS